MTARELYRNALIEINKLEAPPLLLEDYNYFINKAVQQYINKVYNRFDINQQSTDDLRVLEAHAILSDFSDPVIEINKKSKTKLPDDYLHLLGCIVEFQAQGQNKCGTIVDHMVGANKLTADVQPQIIMNSYMAPSYENPY